MEPLERLLNLVALLLHTDRPLPFDQIRKSMEAYGQADKSTAQRQFERDKDLLREIGIPVEVASTDAWDVEQGYRIAPERYYLPEIRFSPEEVAALFVAAYAGGEDGEAAQAFGKLAQGSDTALLSGLAEQTTPMGVDASAPYLDAVAAAVAERRRVRFRYRPTRGRAGKRDVDSWGLVFSRGSWYLVGRDRRRRELRSFRLSRFLSPVEDAGEAQEPPEGFRAAEALASGPWGLGEPETTAQIAFSPKVAWWAVAQTRDATAVRTRRDGWTEARVPAARTDAFVSWVISFGPDAKVVAPKPIREAVIRTLEAVRATV